MEVYLFILNAHNMLNEKKKREIQRNRKRLNKPNLNTYECVADFAKRTYGPMSEEILLLAKNS